MTTREALELLSREVQVEAHTPSTHITLPNGWTVSVGYSPFHYCDRTDDPHDCEVAIWDTKGRWVSHPGEDNVYGHVAAEDLLRVVDAVAQAHLTGDCPCPDCVLTKAR